MGTEMLFAEASMSEVVQIVSVIFTFFTVVFTGVMAYKTAQLNANQAKTVKEVVKLKISNEEAVTKLTEIGEKVEVVHLATNSMKEDLVAATDRFARSEGKAEGRLEEQERVGESSILKPGPSEVVIVNPEPVPVTDKQKGR